MKLNINDYTAKDLLEFFEIPPDYSNFSSITQHIDRLIKKTNENQELVEFLQAAKNKLKSYYLSQSKKIVDSMSSSSINFDSNINTQEYTTEEEDDDEENDNKEDNDDEEDNNNKTQINNFSLLNLVDANFKTKNTEDIYLNINTENREFTNKTILEDTGDITFNLPKKYKNVKELKLIDINIDYNCINIVSGNNPNPNNKFDISYNGKSYEIAIYPHDNTINSLKNSIKEGLSNKISPINKINFNISFGYAYFDFSGFYNDTTIYHNQDQHNIELIFQDNNNSRNLHSILGFVQLETSPEKKLQITHNTKTSSNNPIFNIFGKTDMSYILQAPSPVSLKVNNIYFVLDEYVQNNSHNNLIFLKNMQESSKKILAKLNLQTTTYNDNEIFGEYVISNANIITNYNNTRIYDAPANIQKLKVTIVDEYGNTLFLNYKNYSFTLKIKTLLNYITNYKNVTDN